MRTRASRVTPLLVFVFLAGVAGLPRPSEAQDNALPKYLRDRGTGIPSSRFGVYIARGQLLINPFFAYSRDHNREYQPAALGFGLNQDFRGRFRSSEGQIFIGYGVTDWLAVEFEAALIRASLRKAASDPSTAPTEIKESGLSKLKTHRIVSRFVERGIATAVKTGNTNEITLTPWLKQDLKDRKSP